MARLERVGSAPSRLVVKMARRLVVSRLVVKMVLRRGRFREVAAVSRDPVPAAAVARMVLARSTARWAA